jgi:hypothetical protein
VAKKLQSYFKQLFMKTSGSTNNRQGKQGQSHKPVPDTRNQVDSRSNEEWDNKGDDITHNKKEQHSKRKGTTKGKVQEDREL